jgi:predicted aldo/keto reductase-like oxidoreductase
MKRFVPFIESGELDVALLVLNFIDRYTYGVEELVLPLALKHNVGVVAMKVFGGIQGGFRNYNGPPRRAQLDQQYLELALRYTMGLPGVATMSIGVHDTGQVRKNVEMVKSYRPLTTPEHDQLAQLGRKLAPQWGPWFGPVAD